MTTHLVDCCRSCIRIYNYWVSWDLLWILYTRVMGVLMVTKARRGWIADRHLSIGLPNMLERHDSSTYRFTLSGQFFLILSIIPADLSTVCPLLDAPSIYVSLVYRRCDFGVRPWNAYEVLSMASICKWWYWLRVYLLDKLWRWDMLLCWVPSRCRSQVAISSSKRDFIWPWFPRIAIKNSTQHLKSSHIPLHIYLSPYWYHILTNNALSICPRRCCCFGSINICHWRCRWEVSYCLLS